MVGTLEQEPELTLHLAMVGGVEHVGVPAPAACVDTVEHLAAGLVDQLVGDMDHRVDLADLVRCQLVGPEQRRDLVIELALAFVPFQPVARLP